MAAPVPTAVEMPANGDAVVVATGAADAAAEAAAAAADTAIGAAAASPPPPDPEEEKPLHLRVEWLCFLCRRDLPEVTEADEPLEPCEEWERQLFTFCESAPGIVPHSVITSRVDATDGPFWRNKGWRLRDGATPEGRAVDFCMARWCRCHEAPQVLHAAHRHCWALIQHLTPASGNVMFELARRALPLVRPACARATSGPGFYWHPDLQLDRTSRLGRLLGRVAGLPQEMRDAVGAQLPESLVFSLLAALQTAHVFMQPLDTFGVTGPRRLPGCAAARLTALHATSARIYGRTYLKDLSFEAMDGAAAIPVRSRRIAGCRFALDQFGLRGIRIVYADGSLSPWLGDCGTSWYGILVGDDLAKLRVIFDDLRVLRLSFDDGPPGATSREAEQRVLWDCEVALAENQERSMAHVSSELSSIQHYFGWRLCSYLSFEDDGEYIRGLVLYCDPLGINGAVALGKTTTSIGSLRGHPVYLPLGEDEYITSVWVRTCTVAWNYQGPALLMTTNKGRSKYFGPYFFTHGEDDLRTFTWTRLGGALPGVVTGLFFDLVTQGSTRLNDFGITRAARRPALKFLGTRVPRVPRADEKALVHPLVCGHHLHEVFFSTASLRHVRALSLRRVGGRCVGLEVVHNNKSVELLGHWNPEDTSLIERVYDQRDGPLKQVAFGFSCSTPGAVAHVLDIAVRFDDRDAWSKERSKDMEWLVFDVTKDMRRFAWWFSAEHDEIQWWEGRRLPIEESVTPLRTSTVR